MNSRSLPTGYQIHNYKIEQVLGEGGFGITYKAIDLNLNRPVAIKEFIPSVFAVRSDTGDVEPKNAGSEKYFQTGLLSYVKEAQALALFKHENIVQVYTFFRHHNTAYLVMEYVEGETLSQWLLRNPGPTEESLVSIMSPILGGLHELHKINLLHRDIKPDNIYICENNRPVLLDFGAVKDLLPRDQSGEMSAVVLTEGYAPPEQYGKSGQGPWTDIYSVGVCLYLAVTGQMVKSATERTTQVAEGLPDPQPALRDLDLRNKYSAHFLDSIQQAISLSPKDRIESASGFRNRLLNSEMSSTNSETLETNADYSQDTDNFDPEADTPTALKIPGVSSDESAELAESGGDIEAPDVRTVGSPVAGTTGGRKKLAKWLIGLVFLAGAGLVLWLKQDLVPDQALDDVMAQIEQNKQTAQALGLPQTAEFQIATKEKQLAEDISSKKLEGSVKETNDYLVSVNERIKATIMSAGSTQNTALLDRIQTTFADAQRLNVQAIDDIELEEFATPATDVESVKSRYNSLSELFARLDSAIKMNKRSYVIGSSKKQIDAAFEACKLYDKACQRQWYEDELEREAILAPFELDKSEVTLNQFKRYAESENIVTTAESEGFSYSIDPDKSFAGVRTEGVSWRSTYTADTGDVPVVHLSRRDAAGYCESQGKRLPTEAEWEYAARGVNRFQYPWGDKWDGSKVYWGGTNSDEILPVNSYPSNSAGYFDLAGSVTEWTSTDSVDAGTGLLKGGSRFDTNIVNIRLPVRRLESVDYTGEDVGFRCARSVESWPAEISQ